MTIRFLVYAAALSLAPAAANAHPTPARPALPAGQVLTVPTEPRPALPLVELVTDLGTILVEVRTDKAPVTGGYFLKYVREGRLDGASFYRAMNVAPGYGLVQAGPEASKALPPIAHEPTSETGLSHVSGALSMARAEPGSARGDFFIIMGDMKSFDAQPSGAGDTGGFAVFAHVIGGMEVVAAILGQPTSPTKGEGVMKGQMLEPKVTIDDARIVEASPDRTTVDAPAEGSTLRKKPAENAN